MSKEFFKINKAKTKISTRNNVPPIGYNQMKKTDDFTVHDPRPGHSQQNNFPKSSKLPD